MGAPSKRAKKIRKNSEFNTARLSTDLKTPPGGSSTVFSWTLVDIKAARDDQMRGNFARPARLAESMRTDDALAVAYENRLDPQRCLRVKLEAASGARGESIAKEADALFGQDGVGIHPDTLADINGCLVNHGVAFAYVVTTPREDGTRVDFEMRAWPIEWVRWDEQARCFKTRVDSTSTHAADIPNDPAFGAVSGSEVPIIHGDGRWVVFKKHEHKPFTQGAALLSAALVWARHAFSVRDWAKGSVSHGNAKVLGELPAGMPIYDEDGELTEEASALLELLQAFANDDSPSGIKPAGSKVEHVVNSSTAWQVFSELVLNAEKAAARIYLGTDGTLGTSGGAPGVDITELFGVAVTRVEGDLTCIERAIDTGVIQPWAAVNFGDSSLAPKRRYVRPDMDEAAVREEEQKREQEFFATIESMKKNGFIVDQAYVDELAKRLGIKPPQLPAETEKAPAIALAPTDIARVVTVNEARASAGVKPLTLPTGELDPDGQLTVEQFALKKAAQVAPATAPAQAPALRRS